MSTGSTPYTFVHTNSKGKTMVYKRHEELGHGGFATVYRVIEQSSQKSYALKVIEKDRISKQHAHEKIQNEINIQASCNHRNVVKLYDSFADADRQYLIMEFCPGGSIESQYKSNGKFTEAQVIKFLADATEGLQYLHSRNIIHRDVKLGNFLYDSDGRVKISDFGLSFVIGDELQSSTVCGTPNYLAPELLLKGAKAHSTKVDVWALGVCVFTLLNGYAPFESVKPSLTYERIKVCNYRFNPTVQLSCLSRDFIQKLLTLNPENRPSIQKLKTHPFVAHARGIGNNRLSAPESVKSHINNRNNANNVDFNNVQSDVDYNSSYESPDIRVNNIRDQEDSGIEASYNDSSVPPRARADSARPSQRVPQIREVQMQSPPARIATMYTNTHFRDANAREIKVMDHKTTLEPGANEHIPFVDKSPARGFVNGANPPNAADVAARRRENAPRGDGGNRDEFQSGPRPAGNAPFPPRNRDNFNPRERESFRERDVHEGPHPGGPRDNIAFQMQRRDAPPGPPPGRRPPNQQVRDRRKSSFIPSNDLRAAVYDYSDEDGHNGGIHVDARARSPNPPVPNARRIRSSSVVHVKKDKLVEERFVVPGPRTKRFSTTYRVGTVAPPQTPQPDHYSDKSNTERKYKTASEIKDEIINSAQRRKSDSRPYLQNDGTPQSVVEGYSDTPNEDAPRFRDKPDRRLGSVGKPPQFQRSLSPPRTNSSSKNYDSQGSSMMPSYCISRFWDQSVKYGMGYLLMDGTVGVVFNDRSRMILEPHETFIQYYPNMRSHMMEILGLSSSDHIKKISILRKFAQSLKSAAGMYDLPTTLYSAAIPLQHVKDWVRSDGALLFKLENGDMQVNFEDKKKLFIFTSWKKIILVDNIRNSAPLIHIDQLRSEPASEESRRLALARKLMGRLEREHDGSQ